MKTKIIAVVLIILGIFIIYEYAFYSPPIETQKIYDNPEVGFSFEFPSDITLLKETEYNTNPELSSLKVELKEIGYFETPMEYSREQAMETIAALSAGEFGLEYDFPLPASKQVRTVGFLFAQDFLVLGRFEICDVTLERKLLFYFNNKQIVITLYAPLKTLKSSMPEYFIADENNCGDEKRWDLDKQTYFYNKLVNGNASAEIQTWFDSFNQISESIIFAHR